jgi:copper chaperone NosL
MVLQQGCSVKPEPLIYGKDMCHTCKMTLVDQKFGAEMITKKGKVYKFDDVNCLINFYTSGYEESTNIQQILVADFANENNLTDVTTAYFVRAEAIRSPMASGVAAFSTEDGLNSFYSKWKGELLTWNELVQKLK